jgi:hypothetical protein
LAGIALTGLYQAGYRKTTMAVALGTVAYYVGFLGLYYTTMHGDRPRWQEAVVYLQSAAKVDGHAKRNPQIYASVPGVVAHYLGIPPDQTMQQCLVGRLPEETPADVILDEQWYLVEACHIPEHLRGWLSNRCALVATFAAYTGPIDRSIRIYHHAGPREYLTNSAAALQRLAF